MIKVVAVGDISLGDHYFNMGHGTASFIDKHGLAPILAAVRDEFSDADIVFGNLETPLRGARNGAEHSFEAMAFCGRTEMAEQLAAAGFNIINVANNHILQHGEATFHETVAALQACNISPLGMAGGTDYCCRPVFRQIGAKTIALLGYSAVNEVYRPGQKLYAQFVRDAVLSDIQKVRATADFVFVSLHFGVEGIALPSDEARQTARWLIDNGVDLLLGHHPHIFQPVEVYRERVIAYSLGDFIFDLFWNRSYLDSAITKIIFREPEQFDLQVVPTTFAPDFAVRKLTGKRRADFIAALAEAEKLVLECPVERYQSMVDAALKKMQRLDGAQKFWYFLKVLAEGYTAQKIKFFGKKISSRIGI